MSLEATLVLARANPVADLPRMAAAIYSGKRLVSVGFNSRRTHPLQARFGRNDQSLCLHAEIAAIAAAKCDVTGMMMFVARVLKNDQSALARPCIGCQRAIAAFGLGDVQWTT